MTHRTCMIAKGIKVFKCIKCGKESTNYANGVELCGSCLTKDNLCAVCGKPILIYDVVENTKENGENIGNEYKKIFEKIKNTPPVITTPSLVELIELPLTYEELKKKCKDQEKEIIKLKNVIKSLCE